MTMKQAKLFSDADLGPVSVRADTAADEEEWEEDEGPEYDEFDEDDEPMEAIKP